MSQIVVEKLGKKYKNFTSRSGRLLEALSGGVLVRHVDHWVLRDVTFQVDSGDSVGIIGLNGAGKSTLLKILTGTTVPTEGFMRCSGKTAALLELGMGFHPLFTGRQNAVMGCQLLGHSASVIEEILPRILGFSDLGNSIDESFRTYSTGMQMRLAFSVATAVRPDVLIVDEALSVGDVYFQHKSMQRIREFKEQGTTLLFVSHDPGAVKALCNRAILLDKGQVAMQGDPETVLDYYNALLANHQEQSVQQVKKGDGLVQTRSGTGEASIAEVMLLNEKDERVDSISVGSTVVLKIKTHINKAIPRLVLGYMIKDRLGQTVYGTNTHHLGQVLEDLESENSVDFRFKFTANLGPGTYSIAVALHGESTHLGGNYEWRDLALVFTVINTTRYVFEGVSWLPPQLECSI